MTQAINHPVFSQARNRNAVDTRKREERQLLKGLKTRALKLDIALLEVMLKVPHEHPDATRDHRERSAMGARLQLFRRELERRDARDEFRATQPQTPARLSDSLGKLKSKFH